MNSENRPPGAHVAININLCNGCGNCVCVCIPKAIAMDKVTGKVKIVNINYCNACANCISYCGEFALQLVSY